MWVLLNSLESPCIIFTGHASLLHYNIFRKRALRSNVMEEREVEVQPEENQRLFFVDKKSRMPFLRCVKGKFGMKLGLKQRRATLGPSYKSMIISLCSFLFNLLSKLGWFKQDLKLTFHSFLVKLRSINPYRIVDQYAGWFFTWMDL